MIARRLRTNQIVIQQGTGSEIESFTLLHLNTEELNALLSCVSDWKQDGEGFKVSHVSVYGDKLDEVFKTIAVEHSKTNPNFLDVTKKYTSQISGSSMLIRDPEKHVIKIAWRKGNTCAINKLIIDNQKREQFFRDAKSCKCFIEKGKYFIDARDEVIYTYWSNYMNRKYIENIQGVNK